MTPRLPTEIFAMIIEHADPFVLFNLACSCSAMLDLCAERLKSNQELASKWQTVFCVNYESPGDIEGYWPNIVELGSGIVANHYLPYYVHSFYLGGQASDSHPEDRPDRVYEDTTDQLTRINDSAVFPRPIDIGAWLEDPGSNEEEVGQIIVKVLSEAPRLKHLSIHPSALLNKCVSSLFMSLLPRNPEFSGTTGFPYNLEKLEIRSYWQDHGPDILSIELLLLFPMLRVLELSLEITGYRVEKTRLPSDDVIPPLGSRQFPNLHDLHISGLIGLDAFSFLMERSPRLKSVSFLGNEEPSTDLPTFRQAYSLDLVTKVFSKAPSSECISKLDLHVGRPVGNCTLKSLPKLRELNLRFPEESLLEISQIPSFSKIAPRSLVELSVSSRTGNTDIALLESLFKGFNLDEWVDLRLIEIAIKFHLDCERDPWHSCHCLNKAPSSQAIKMFVSQLESFGISVCPVAYSLYEHRERDRLPPRLDIERCNYDGSPKIISHSDFAYYRRRYLHEKMSSFWPEYITLDYHQRYPDDPKHPTLLWWNDIAFHIGGNLCVTDQDTKELDVRVPDSAEKRDHELRLLRQATLRS